MADVKSCTVLNRLQNSCFLSSGYFFLKAVFPKLYSLHVVLTIFYDELIIYWHIAMSTWVKFSSKCAMGIHIGIHLFIIDYLTKLINRLKKLIEEV